MDELPIELDDQYEPSPSAIEQQGLTVCAVIADMTKIRGSTVASAFKEHGSGEQLRLYGFDWNLVNYCRSTVGGVNPIWDFCESHSHESIIFFDQLSGNMFFRHVENERLLFMGSESFVRSCLKILTRSIADEAAMVMKEEFLDEAGIQETQAFLDKYNKLPTFVGPG